MIFYPKYYKMLIRCRIKRLQTAQYKKYFTIHEKCSKIGKNSKGRIDIPVKFSALREKRDLWSVLKESPKPKVLYGMGEF